MTEPPETPEQAAKRLIGSFAGLRSVGLSVAGYRFDTAYQSHVAEALVYELRRALAYELGRRDAQWREALAKKPPSGESRMCRACGRSDQLRQVAESPDQLVYACDCGTYTFTARPA